MTASRTALDADRWHFQHGPIDVVIEAHGDASAVGAAHAAAWQRFGGVLEELVAELPALRRPVSETAARFEGPIAQRMSTACAPHSDHFITSMAAVAGSVADELIAFYDRPGIARAWVNNGGDIALHLAPGQSVRVGLFADVARFDLRDAGRVTTDGQFAIGAELPVRGVATSGWRGRSFSLGIADSVTVLATTASAADAAATLVANAVDVVDAGILRRPARECKDDSDLGDTPVTLDVAQLLPAQVRRALDAGEARAIALQQRGLLWSAVLVCQGQWRMVEPLCSVGERAQRGVAADSESSVGSVFA